MSVPVSVEPPSPPPPRRSGFQTLRTQAASVPRAWLPGAVGYACLLIGLLDVASAVFPKLRRTRMHSFAGQLPGGTTTLAAVGTLMVGLLLVLLAHALRRRKQRAWRAVCVLLPIGAALHILRWHQIGPAVVSLVLLAVMLVHRGEFYAKADPAPAGGPSPT